MPKLRDALDRPCRGVAFVDTGPFSLDHHSLDCPEYAIFDEKGGHRFCVGFPSEEAVVHQDFKE